MAHRSESEYSLEMERYLEHEQSPQIEGAGHVYVINLLRLRRREEELSITGFRGKFDDFFLHLPEESVVVFISDCKTALDLTLQVEGKLKFRLWVAVERLDPLMRPSHLPDNHAAVIVFTKHKMPFKHSKIRIGYTNCPACGKTTKDYGGKKHLYNPYGTLMSDVWRDIKIDEEGVPEAVLGRLADLFSVEPYSKLVFYDFREDKSLFSDNSDKKHKFEYYPLESHSLSSQLVNADCIDSLKNLPESSIDFAFADPPYNIKKKYDNWDDGIEIEEYFSWCDKWIKEIYRVLKPGRVFCLLNIPLWVVRHYMFAKGLFSLYDFIAWEALGLPVRNIMPAHYSLLCLSKGVARPISNYDYEPNLDSFMFSSQSLKEWYCARNSCIKSRNKPRIRDRSPLTNLWWDIHRLKHNSKRVDHPCQLPPDLMKRLIYTFTELGEIVLDPFNGAGTTTLVAEMMGRKYIGIELSEKYHQITCQRHIDISNELDPFRKTNTTPKSKNSRVRRLSNQQYRVSKKKLQLEVRQIAKDIGRKPTRDDVREHTQYPFEYFESYFIDWGEVCAAVGDKGMDENFSGDEGNDDQLTLL